MWQVWKSERKERLYRLKHKRIIWVYLAFVVLVAFDMLTKVLTDKIDVTIIEGVLSFSSVYNRGAAWSMFSNYTIILAMLSLVFVCVAVVFDCKTKLRKTKLYNVAYVFILAGAFGNAIDRVFLGYVRDFIKLDFINFPVFNVADSLLVIGVILLAIYILFYNGSYENGKAKIEKQGNGKDCKNGQKACEEELKVDYINKQDLSEEAKKMASTTYNLSKKEEDKKE